MTCAFVCVGESPSMLYCDLSYRDAPREMTDNITFLRTSVRCYSSFKFVDVFYVFGAAAGWLIFLCLLRYMSF